MRRAMLLGLVGVLVVAAVGCYTAPVIPPMGVIYADYKAPLTTEPQGQAVVPKKGEASSQSVLGLVAWGDCSLQAAAAGGGLSTVNYADYSYLNVVFGIYQKFTVTVHGN